MPPVCEIAFPVDYIYRINTKPNATTSCNECTPLLPSRRPLRNESRINFRLLSLGIIFIGGITIGSYLLAKDSRSIPVTLNFDMVDRFVWDTNIMPAESHLISSNVHNIYIMQTNGFDCLNYVDCLTVIQNMQMAALKSHNFSLPYNFLIGGDGETYEVRGWTEQSGFSFVPHNSSLTIGILGSFNRHPPPDCQISEASALILESLRRHKITENYQIYGIRNVSISRTNSKALFESISKWSHFNSTVNLI